MHVEIKKLDCKSYLLGIASKGEIALVCNPRCIYYYTGYVKHEKDDDDNITYVQHHRPFDLSGYAVFYEPDDNISLSAGFSEEKFPEMPPVFGLKSHFSALWEDIKKYNSTISKPDIFCGRTLLKDLADIAPRILVNNRFNRGGDFTVEFYAFFLDDMLVMENHYKPQSFDVESYTGFVKKNFFFFFEFECL
jgi:hypothetical protein